MKMRLSYILVSLILVLLITPVYVMAIPSAEFLYTETDLGGGWWQYDYTLYNTTSLADGSYNIFDVGLYFDDFYDFEGISLPSGWDGTPAPWTDLSNTDFINAYSLNLGVPPFGTDIQPDSSLSGFSFKIMHQAGDITFDVLLTLPTDAPDCADTDSCNPYQSGGTTRGISPVPEPGTILLVGVGLTLILLLIMVGRLRFRWNKV
ncbi:MAG: hypothetical protein A2035_06280 [Nitrospirae bacterium GWA2_42_11]|nr:MAG: hypothetical protein A2035_06280 [Nitrospirae bacterium GWA2_42_11]